MKCMCHKQIGVLCALTASSLAFTATITVEQDGSGDYTTITEAVNAATKGDTVQVGPGVYNEGPIYLPGDIFYLVSTNGPEETIVTPDIANAPAFLCNVTSNYFPYLFGFTIRGGNTDSNGGGLQVYNGANIAVLNCIFENNQTTGSGGGAWVDIDSVAIFTLCTFRNNTAGVEGGGIANFSPNYAIVQSSLFESNTAGTLGGGVSIGTGGGATKDGNTPPSLVNCVFIGNSAGVEGGGVHIMPSGTGPLYTEGFIDNCTITQNSAPHNGGIALSARHLVDWSGGLFVRNSISYDNDGEPLNYNLENARPRDLPQYNYSCSDNLTDQDFYTNTASEPRFRSPLGPDGTPSTGDEDLQLIPGSPCIDRGNNSFVTSTSDYAGVDRILDDPMTPDPVGVPARVDMGAYEFDVGVFGSLGLAFWTDDSGELTPFQSFLNWYSGVPAQQTVPAYMNSYVAEMQYPELFNNNLIGELNITRGSFHFTHGFENPVPLSLYETTGPDPVWADLNIGPYETEGAPLMSIFNTNVTCGAITIQDGIFISSDCLFSLSGDLRLDGEDTLFAVIQSTGTTIQGIDEETNPTVTNLGVLLPNGPLTIQGTYEQTGTLLDGTPANGNASYGLRIPDEEIIVDGTATLAGGATFYLDTENMPEVGSQFTIASATGGFGGSKFDYVLTAQSADGRFVVVSYATNIGGGDSAIATVLSADSLLQGDPAIEAVGVTLSDALPADIDGDGFEDLILSIDMGVGVDGSVAVLLNAGVSGGTWDGFESFGGAYSISVGKQPRGLDVGFIDSDAFLDVVVACYEDGTVVVLGNTSDVDPDLFSIVAILDAEGIPAITSSPLPLDVWVGDLDGDSDSDILVTNEFDGSVVAYQNTTSLLGVSFGNPMKSQPVTGITKFMPGIGGGIRDLPPLGNSGHGNGDDGAESGSPNVPLGPGGIVMTWTHYDTGANPVDIDSGDLNGDGFFDAVTTNMDSDTVSILLGAPGNTFAPANTFDLGSGYTQPESVAVGDFDGDGDLDLVVVCTNASSARVTLILRNTLDPPSGSYGLVVEPTEGLEGLSPYLVRSADVDEDGDDDIIALTESSSFTGDSISSVTTTAITEELCVGDFNGSETVDGADLAMLLGAWGTMDTKFDLNGDGAVGGADLSILLGAWGPCPGDSPLD